MRFVWSVVAFVLAALLIGGGIAQRTILAGPKSVTSSISVDQAVPYVLIDGSVLASHEGTQTVKVQGAGTVFASYARTSDATAWLARSNYEAVTMKAGTVKTSLVSAPAVTTDAPAPTTPVGSDLWLQEFKQEGVIVTSLQLPKNMSLVVASDGKAAAPTSISVTWPVHVHTPWAGPMMVLGALVLLAGLILYGLGLRHARRSRGPRRKGLPAGPSNPSIESAEKGVISAAPSRRSLTRGKRAFIAVPTIAAAALAFAGCTADSWPQMSASPSPSPTASLAVPEGQGSPAVTDAQAELILGRVSATVAAADKKLDASLAAQRVAGSALEVRETNYALRKKIKTEDALPAIGAKKLSILLPEAYDQWPRTFLAVVEDAKDKSATIITLTQETAWSQYKLTNTGSLPADTHMPELAPWWVGALQTPPDSAFLVLPPDRVAAAYANVLDQGDKSAFAQYFEQDTDTFRTQITKGRADRLAAFNKTGSKTGKLSFSSSAGDAAPTSLATIGSGAIVAVTVDERDTVIPTDADAVIKLDGNDVVKALTGVSQSKTGFATTYRDQLFFYVPAQSSAEKIQMLGYSSNILSAKVIKK